VREQLQNIRVAHTRLQTDLAIEKGDAAADRVRCRASATALVSGREEIHLLYLMRLSGVWKAIFLPGA
jgi:hypothetical protein